MGRDGRYNDMLHEFWSLVLDVGEWTVSRTGRFFQRKRAYQMIAQNTGWAPGPVLKWWWNKCQVSNPWPSACKILIWARKASEGIKKRASKRQERKNVVFWVPRRIKGKWKQTEPKPNRDQSSPILMSYEGHLKLKSPKPITIQYMWQAKKLNGI